MAPTDLDEFEQGLEALHLEAAGVLSVHVARNFYQLTAVSNREAFNLRLARATLRGDALAVGILQALRLAADDYRASAKRQPRLCLCCRRHITNLCGTVATILVPDTEIPSRCLTTVVCARCAQRPDQRGRTCEALRAVWPELRAISVVHEAGHARPLQPYTRPEPSFTSRCLPRLTPLQLKASADSGDATLTGPLSAICADHLSLP